MDKQERKESLLKAKDADAASVARNTPILISFLTEPDIISI